MSGVGGLFNVPLTPDELVQWSHIHMANHRDINRRIREALLFNMPEPLLDPFDPKNMGNWPDQHQQLHQLMNTIIGNRGNDLLTVPFDNESAWATWILLHAQEHDAAERIIGGVTVNPVVRVFSTPGTYNISLPYFLGFLKVECWGAGGGGGWGTPYTALATAGSDSSLDGTYIGYGGGAGAVANVSPPPLQFFAGGAGGSYANGDGGSVAGDPGQQGSWDIQGSTSYKGGGLGGSNSVGGGGGSGTGYPPNSPGTSPAFPGGDGGSPGGGGGGVGGGGGGGAGGYMVKTFYPGGPYRGGQSVTIVVGAGGTGGTTNTGSKAGGTGGPGAVRLSWRA